MNEGCKCLKCYNVYAVFEQAFAYKDTGFPYRMSVFMAFYFNCTFNLATFVLRFSFLI